MHRNQMEHGMSAQTATQAMAEIRLDGEADEHGSDAAMASGDACALVAMSPEHRAAPVGAGAWKVGWGGRSMNRAG